MEYPGVALVWKGIVVILGVAGYLLYAKRKESGGVRYKGGSTPTLDAFAIDFTRLAKEKRIDPVVGRESEILRLAQVLSRRSKNNAILLGAPGVGKTAIVEGIANRIVSGEVPGSLKNKRLLALDVTSLLSGTKYRGEFEQRAKKIVSEIQSANRSIILFIDEIHSIIQSSGTEGAINFADILKPALARGDLQMIGATTDVEYKKYIQSDSSLERRFQPIDVKEPNEEETIQILQGVKDKFREYHQVEFTDAAIEVAVRLTKKKIVNRKLPDKALDAIDEAAAMVKVSHVHEAIPGVLYQAAAQKDPAVHDLWKRIQDVDAQLLKADKNKSKALTQQREELETELAMHGIITVDADDVEKIILEWARGSIL